MPIGLRGAYLRHLFETNRMTGCDYHTALLQMDWIARWPVDPSRPSTYHGTPEQRSGVLRQGFALGPEPFYVERLIK